MSVRIRGHVLRLATAVTLLALAAAPATATVVVTGAPIPGVPPIPRGFVGLPIEYPSLPAYTGTDPRQIDAVFERLIRSLSPGGAPSLRIGGVSADHTWWPAKGISRTPGITFTLTPTWLAAAGALVRDIDAQTLFGVNLEANNPALAAGEASALTAAVGRRHVAGFEIGNEPSNYPHFAWYRVHGRPVYGRPRSYGFPQFTRDVTGVVRRLPGLPIAGPALAGYGWLTRLGEFLRAVPRTSTVTFHRYPLNKCFPPAGSPERVTLTNLLAPFAAGGFLARARPFVSLAHQHGARFRLDEFNSVSCSGKAGLSDTFASALWAADTLFEVARDGIDGVNVHTFPGAPYAPFDVSRAQGRWSGIVHPEYYGLLLFVRASAPGARLLTVSGRTPAGVRVWATRSPDRTIRVVVINKDAGHAYRGQLSLPGARGPASLQRLLGPSLRATRRVTLGGQSVASLTGELGGAAQGELIRPHSSRYSVTVPAASAVLLTVADVQP